MKFFRIATLCVAVGVSSFANAFVVPGARVQQPTPLNLMTGGGNRMRRNNGPADYRMDEYYGEEAYRNRREAGYSISPNHHGEQFERYDPMRHTKEGKTYNERRYEFANRDNRYNDYMEDRQYDNRRAQRPHEGGHASRADGRPIVESARGGGRRLERYDPRAHRMNGESRFEPEKMPPTYEQTMRDRPSSAGGPAYQREGSYNWDQPFDERRGNGRRGGRVNNMEGVYRSRNNRSYSSGNSGRVITNDRDRMGGMPPPPPPRGVDDGYGMRGNDRYGMRGGGNERGMNSRGGGWRNENPNFRERQETRSTAELLKNGGNDMFEDSRRGTADRRRGGGVGRRGPSNREPQFRDRGDNGGIGSYGDRRREDYYNQGPEVNRGPGADRYGGDGAYDDRRRPGSAWEREAQTGGRRWEDPYRPGDRTMATRESLNGPQRLDGGTRRQWTFDADVGSVQLEMWTEGLPLMATVEIFEKGGQRKNSFDVYVEDGYSRPYSTVLDLPRQSGGTILIRNDGPVEYPIVANVQPFGSPRDAGYQDRTEEGW